MAQTIVIASGKGGVGKSTTAAAVGAALAGLGKKTLIVDCDAGLNSINVMLQCEEASIYSWYDVYRGSCEAGNAVREIRENLSVLNAPLLRLKDPCEDAIAVVTAPLREAFDFILLDAPAGLGVGLRRAARAAKLGIVIATGDEISVRGAAAVDDAMREAGVKDTRLIINRYDLRAAKKGKYLSIDGAIDRTCVRLLGVVPEDPQLMYYTVTKKMKRGAKSVAAFERIARRICGENVELTLSLLK